MLSQIRRGEAGGLPTYNEYPNTIPLSVPTLAYPDAARRADGVTQTNATSNDPSLPSYDVSAPPKYEYATAAQAAAGAAGGAIQRAASSIRQALSRPGSLRRTDSSATIQQQQTATGRGDPEMQEMTSTNTVPRVMTTAPPMHLTNQSRSQSTTSLSSNQISRSNSMRTARSTVDEQVSTPTEDRMESIPLEDERSRSQRQL